MFKIVLVGVEQIENKKTISENENRNTYLHTLKTRIMKTIEFFKKTKSRFNFLPVVLLALVIGFTSCDDDDDPAPMPEMEAEEEKTIVDVAAEAGSFNVLIQAAQKAGLADFLSTEKNITVFAPTDDAFAALLTDLGASSLDDLDAATLAAVLKYHVVGDLAYSNNLSSGAVATLNTDSPDETPLSILVNVDGGVMVNNATVTTADVMASNGVIHVIDKVLLPPTVVDLATYSESFTSLVSAVVKADLAGALSGDGPFTVFAPTNDAFAALFAALGISDLDEVAVEDLTSILTYHVVGDNVMSTELSAGSVASISGEEFEVTIDGEVMINGTVKVVATDIQGTNGVIHVIDAVLVPEMQKSNTIADIAVANSEFSILVEALMKADLVGAVADSEAELTVFAPTNDAFVALLSELGATSLDDVPVGTLTDILLYHVIGSKAMSTDLASGYFPTLSTFSDNNLSMYIEVGEGVTINGNTMVTAADIEADNGVIHVVDKVILPPSVVDIAIANENFSTLVSAVVKAGLVDALSGEGPFTVFAPTNAAFDALFAELGIAGIYDLTAEELTPILLYHVVSGNVLSTDLANGEVPTLKEGSSITVDLSSGVMINESNVVAADVQGANGVIHVIDKVLLP
ncbi:transforming growth factor-beta-induced protein [Draconibacterium orientale]|uniref:Fasciclin n=2 Tax=Draconibacterium orientale TaxID=1168034 RepID=X5DHE6_9BACT|nr:fasciclin [Draconibacterium orientale]SET75248.1 transforming growth factor-beta-induced protein [Draconibacterium orientale]